MRSDGHVPKQSEETEHQRVGRQERSIALDYLWAIATENSCERVWVQEQGKCRTEGQCSVGRVLGRLKQEEECLGVCCGLVLCRLKDRSKPTKLNWDDDDRCKQQDEDHRVLDQCNHGRGTQTAGVGVCRKDDECDDQWDVNG